MTLAVFALRRLLRDDEAILHLRVGLVFLLLVIAMIAPLVVLELQLLPAPPGGAPRRTIATLIAMLAVAVGGLALSREKRRRMT